MDEEKVHRLILIVLIFNVMFTVLLSILEPMFGILWLLFFLLICVIIRFARPDIWNVEAKRIKRKISKIKKKMNDVPEDTHIRNFDDRPRFKLVGLRAKDNIDVRISKDIFLIGRSTEADCRIKNYDTVGRKHCRIVYRKYSQEYYIEDLRSENGTFLGTHKLEPFTQYILADGVQINVGGCLIRFVKQ